MEGPELRVTAQHFQPLLPLVPCSKGQQLHKRPMASFVTDVRPIGHRGLASHTVIKGDVAEDNMSWQPPGHEGVHVDYKTLLLIDYQRGRN